MRSVMKVVCLLYVIKLCRGHMFNMDLIEPPENPGPGMTYQKAPSMQMMSDYNINRNRNKNAYRTLNKEEEPDLSDLDTTLTKMKKWEDFEEIAEAIAIKNRGKKHVNFEDDVKDLSKWLKDLKEGNVQKEAMRTDPVLQPFQNNVKSWKKGSPSPGMSMYWPEEAIKQEEPVFPNQNRPGGRVQTTLLQTPPKFPKKDLCMGAPPSNPVMGKVRPAGQLRPADIPVADVMNMARNKMREAQFNRIPSPHNQPLPEEFEGNTFVAPSDDGIGPHARHKRSLPNWENSFYDHESDAGSVPFFGDDTIPRIGNGPRTYQREFPQTSGRGPKSALRQRGYPLPTEDGAPLSGPGYPQGVYPQTGYNSPMGFLNQGAMPQRPPPPNNGPMPAPPQADYPQMGPVEYMESPYTGIGTPFEETAQRPGVLPLSLLLCRILLTEQSWSRSTSNNLRQFSLKTPAGGRGFQCSEARVVDNAISRLKDSNP
ncbi:hypothetical protein MSG28_015642 [Choristoneura fumiferana]|uniref:Uncharacterized protein n=1 Tax=Choristoneura fumiferana TaxID=7141 RepID=A0ACC0KC51_CHOFU|nr:hypothetical protein MSG28_015642 [Choristoneura fumiferana]